MERLVAVAALTIAALLGVAGSRTTPSSAATRGSIGLVLALRLGKPVDKK